MGKSNNRKIKGANNFTLNLIQPMNDIQDEVLESPHNLVLHGCPGTGKTFLALYIALSLLHEKKDVEKIVIARSAVATRNIGYMPGTLAEKLKIYEEPYRDICSILYGRGDAYDNFKTRNLIEFISTSNIRGKTLRNCVVIVDEFSNLTYHELRSVITRVGDVEKVIFSGDKSQTDITNNGVDKFLNILEQMEQYPFEIFEFEPEDIVRSGLVREFIEIEYESSNKQ